MFLSIILTQSIRGNCSTDNIYFKSSVKVFEYCKKGGKVKWTPFSSQKRKKAQGDRTETGIEKGEGESVEKKKM